MLLQGLPGKVSYRERRRWRERCIVAMLHRSGGGTSEELAFQLRTEVRLHHIRGGGRPLAVVPGVKVP